VARVAILLPSPDRVVEGLEELADLVGRRIGLGARPVEILDLVLGLGQGGAADLAGAAERLERDPGAVVEPGEVGGELVQAGRGRPQVGEQRGLLLGEDAELVADRPQALKEVVEPVDVTGEVVLDRGPVGGRGDRGLERLIGAARLAVEEVLGDQRLRLRRAARVCLQLREIGADLEADQGGLPRGDVEVGDRPRVDAGDPELGALYQAEGVEELGPVAPLVVGARGGGDRHSGGGE
jgi:hypothetical protein